MVQTAKLEGIKGFEEQKTKGVSPWALSLQQELGEERRASSWSYTLEGFLFDVVEGDQSLWIVARFPAGGEVALRAAYCPYNNITINEMRSIDDGVEHGLGNGVDFDVSSVTGDYHIRLEFPNPDRALLRCTTTLIPAAPLFLPYWPRDVIPLGTLDDLSHPEGVIYTKQVEARSGMVYFSLSKPQAGAVMYFQNLTALNEYAEKTKTSLAEVVGGNWPELGLALPAALEEPLEAGKEVIISDAFILFNASEPRDDLEMAKQFLDSLAQIYLVLPRPETKYIHWPDIAKKSLHDLINSEKCWSEVRGRRYLNAYVSDFDTPPESMVQLTVLLPLLEYSDWSKQEIPMTEEILGGLPRFYDEKAKVLVRWLVTEAGKLDGSEDHRKPEVVDSWYLYHSLLNLSRLAIRGDKTAHKLFLDSMDYAIKDAHTFNYRWPVFYDLYTLEVIKAETKEGEGGEADVAGLYAHVMLQAWELTKEARYLEEAKKAARTLKGLGFNMFYQANETLFGAGALLRLWKETGDEQFLNLSYLSLANIFNNVWLWECNYGYAKDYKTFFALFPLKEAPYTAVYEELEGFAALHDYLGHYEGEVPEWLNILVPEFIRNMLYKGSFYYPPNLPEEAMTQKPKTGELDTKLWIPLEDIYDGWEKAGQVGQEVYGAGMPFGVIPRNYWRIPDEDFMIYIEYPIKDFSTEEPGQATFFVQGDPRLSCRLRLMPTGRKSLPGLEVQAQLEGHTEKLKGRETAEGHIEYEIFGNHQVTVNWSKSNSRKGKE